MFEQNGFMHSCKTAVALGTVKLLGKMVLWSIVRTAMAAENSGGDWSVGKVQVQVDDQSTPPSIHHSVVVLGRCISSLTPLLCGKMKGGRESSWKRRSPRNPSW